MSETEYCQFRAETDGCTEHSCMYHGDENRTKFKDHKESCSQH